MKRVARLLRNSPILKIVVLIGLFCVLYGSLFASPFSGFVGLCLLVLAGIGWLAGDLAYFFNYIE